MRTHSRSVYFEVRIYKDATVQPRKGVGPSQTSPVWEIR